MAIVSDEAVCIRHWDWSETSQTVALFTRGNGVVRAIAKGSRREKSGFSGGIELLTRGTAMMSLKKSDALTLLTAWDLHETFAPLRTTLQSFYAAMTLAEVLGQAIQPLDPHPLTFAWTLRSLRLLCSEVPSQSILLDAMIVILQETGHAPELYSDVITGADLHGGEDRPGKTPQIVYFLPALGGASVQPGDESNPQPDAWKTRLETLSWLANRWSHVLHSAKLAALEPQSPDDMLHAADDLAQGGPAEGENSTAVRDRALRLLLAYFQYSHSVQGAAVKTYIELMFPSRNR
jgi:recombinational DNA repair protein (RecF pathway)